MTDMKIPHSFTRLGGPIGPSRTQEMSDKELAMLHAAGNINNLISNGAFPTDDEITFTDEPTHFSTEGSQMPEEETTTEIATRVLGRVERGEGGGASPR